MTKVYQHIRSQLIPVMSKLILDICSDTQENDVLAWADAARRNTGREAVLAPLLQAPRTLDYHRARKLVKGLKAVLNVSMQPYTYQATAIAQCAFETTPLPELGDWVWLYLIQDAIGLASTEWQIPTLRIAVYPSLFDAPSRWDLTIATYEPTTQDTTCEIFRLDGASPAEAHLEYPRLKQLFHTLCQQQSAALAWLVRDIKQYLARSGPWVPMYGNPETIVDYHSAMNLDQYETRYHA